MKLNKENFNKLLNKKYIFENKPLLAVGVSGGPDSMGLLFLINNWNKTVNGNLIALIVNHNIRKESTEEALRVSKLLKNLKIKSKILAVDKKNIKKRNMNEARENRYNLLLNYCKKNNILHLFLGHHKDDNIETFLSRKVAGSDFDGLKSMNEITIREKICIIRPLLDFSKKEILNLNYRNKVSYLSDPSNFNLKYTRPKIRKFLNETNLNIINEIKNEFREIKENSKFYNIMLSELLIKSIYFSSNKYVKLKLKNFVEFDILFQEKIIKKIYNTLFENSYFIRSNKIQLLIEEIKKPDFKVFNLKSMLVKKTTNSLVFSKKSN